MRSRFSKFSLPVLAAMLFVAGCDYGDSGTFTAELDEPSYRQGKDRVRQGRTQEALAEFQKVIERRGLNNAPESHLELALIYKNHIHDPIAAIYHFRKFRELRPNTEQARDQAKLVEQQIEAAKREFARTLPGKPLENPLLPADYTETIERLQRENAELNAALKHARVSAGLSVNRTAEEIIGVEVPATEAEVPATNPVSAGAGDEAVVVSPTEVAAPSTDNVRPITFGGDRPNLANPTTPAATPRPTSAPSAAGRRHVVKQKETLSSIVRQYYGSATNAKIEELFQANRDQMKSKSDLKIGMELKIP